MYTRQTKLTTSTKILVALFWGVFSSSAAHDCHRNLEPVWQSDVGSSPVVSSPVLADLNGDNVKDVLVTSFNGQVSVLDGRSGQDLPGWPVTLSGKMLFAAPLLVREAYTMRESKKFPIQAHARPGHIQGPVTYRAPVSCGHRLVKEIHENCIKSS